MKLGFWIQESTKTLQVSATYDKSGSKIYIDGKRVASQKINPLKVDVVDAIFRIGCEVDAKGQFWNGALDEIRIQSVARTEDEIRVSMNSPLTGQEDGLVGYWNFDDGTTKDLTAIATVSFSYPQFPP